jgi:hypothetical protein
MISGPCVRRLCLVAVVAALFVFSPRIAGAWAIGSQLDSTGCHEPITAEALRRVRLERTTAPPITPTRDEAALIDDVLFSPPADFVHDLAGMTLLLGVRDNDLKGIDPLSSLDLIQVHGDPATQHEHCIRGPADDGTAGDQQGIETCRAFIRDLATAALDGLDANGTVDPDIRIRFVVYVGLAGRITPSLPLFYVKIGAAMHALEDSFAHTYRSADGIAVTSMLNWVDLVGTDYDEARDGAPHRAELDRCWQPDAVLARNYELSIQAAAELLSVALDPALTRDQKIVQFDAVTAKYLTYQPGCSFDNQWCDPPEAQVTSSLLSCNSSGEVTLNALILLVFVIFWLAHRRAHAGAVLAIVLVAGSAMSASADTAVAAVDPVSTTAPTTEPHRDIPTITAAEVKSVRKDKELGNAFGFTASVGGSINRGALFGTIGGRYRLSEHWLVGVDAGWNPWITTAPLKERRGVALVYGTLIRRFPMRFDRVNLRSTLHLGVATLLFDVYGAPKYSTGPYLAISPLGIDYDLGNHVRLVIDPVEFALPVPVMGQLPLYYEQVRLMVGIQIGA